MGISFFRRILMEKKGFFQRSLDRVEFVGNKLPHPVTLFALLAFLVLILSAFISSLNIEVEHPGIEGEIVSVTNLLTNEGIAYIFTSMTENFIGFAPVGDVLVTMLGIGLAETIGFISDVVRGLVFAGIMSSVASDAGYIVLPALGAAIFAGLGRHPLAGLAAAFAGVSGGFSANFFLSATDPMLGEMTIDAAKIIDPTYAGGMN